MTLSVTPCGRSAGKQLPDAQSASTQQNGRLRVARENLPEVDFRAGSLTELSAEDASFDLVVCGLALEHLEDMRPALAELCRVLRPGKALLLSMFHPFFMLKGAQPHFEHEHDDVEYEIAGHPHLISTVFSALRALGWTVVQSWKSRASG